MIKFQLFKERCLVMKPEARSPTRDKLSMESLQLRDGVVVGEHADRYCGCERRIKSSAQTRKI